jgi:hypothetical protein
MMSGMARSKSKFAIRSIKAIVAELKASRPGEKIKTSKKPGHYDSVGAWSFDKINDWPSRPPLSVLYQMNNPLRHSKQVLDDPNKLLDYANFSAIGTWNAKGSCNWQSSKGAWIIVDAELVQEQASDDDFFDDEDGDGGYGGSHVDVIVALWKVEEGWAAAVWRPEDRDLLAKLMGLPGWPSKGWKTGQVWYGE